MDPTESPEATEGAFAGTVATSGITGASNIAEMRRIVVGRALPRAVALGVASPSLSVSKKERKAGADDGSTCFGSSGTGGGFSIGVEMSPNESKDLGSDLERERPEGAGVADCGSGAGNNEGVGCSDSATGVSCPAGIA